MDSVDYTIIGGGWTGLLCGYELAKNYPGIQIRILEKSDSNNLGGLLHSEVIDGFTFDTGGPHILFSRDKEILNKILSFLGNNVQKIERNAVIYYKGKYVPYPFENGIYVLDPEERAEMGNDLIEAMMDKISNPNWTPTTFRDWMYGIFGNKIAQEYLEPYNRKIWKTDPSDMDADWVFTPGRLPYPDLKDIIRSIAGIKTVGYKEQQYFYYPKTGGIQALYDGLLSKVKDLGVEFISNLEVISLKRCEDGWLVNGSLSSKKIINTLPLPLLARILQVPSGIKDLIDQLQYTKDVVVGVALDKPSPPEHVIYVPSDKISFHRLTWMPNLAGTSKKEQSNLIAETTVTSSSNADIEKITRSTLEGLRLMNIIDSESEILFTRSWLNAFGYPVYSKFHNDIRKKIFDYLSGLDLYTVGRWGSWHYWNTDMVYKAVLELSKKW